MRRRYPQITCVEVSETDSNSSNTSDTNRDQGENLNCEPWSSSEDQSDQHMRIFPVVLKPAGARNGMDYQHQSGCILCECGDTVPHNSPTKVATTARQQLSLRTGRENASSAESDEHTEFRAWLLAFYTSKVPDKVPYVDVILNRYRGRYDDLKTQLCAKYGELEIAGESESVASDSSSSDDDDDAEPDFAALPFSRDWLLKFYRRFQQEKLLHIDRVLKQFSGREDTLKQMLLQKYWTPKTKDNGNGDTSALQHDGEPTSKRRKVASEAEPLDPATTSDGSASYQEPPKVFVTPQQPTEASNSSSSSLCYVMKYVTREFCGRRWYSSISG